MRVKLLALLAAICLLLGGCYDQKELEDTAFIMGLGLDVGEEQPYRLTVAISKPVNLVGGKKGGEGSPAFLISTETDHLVEGLTELGTLLGRRPSLLHATFMVIGQELAARGLREPFAQLLPLSELRRTMALLITPVTAEAFLKEAKPQIDKGLYRYIPQNTNQSRHHNMSPEFARLNRFLARMEGHGMGVLAYQALLHENGPAKGSAHPQLREGPDLEIVGAAVFLQDKFIGTLTGDEMQYLALLQGTFQRSRVALPPKENEPALGLELRNDGKPRYKLRKGDPWQIEVLIPMEAELVGGRPTQLVGQLADERQIEAEIKAFTEEAINKLVKRLQTELKADVVPFADYARRQFTTYPEWMNYPWQEAFEKAEIQVSVEVILRRNGVQRPPQPH